MQHAPHIVKLGPLQRLRREEVMRDQLNALGRFRPRQRLRHILHDNPAGEIAEFVPEGDGLLALAAAEVDEERLGEGGAGLGADGVHVEPPVVVVHHFHALFEVLHVLRVLAEEFEGGEVCVVSFLEGRVFAGGYVFVGAGFEEVWEGAEGGAEEFVSLWGGLDFRFIV